MTRMQQWLVVATSMLAAGCRSTSTSPPPSTVPSEAGPEPEPSSNPYADLPPPPGEPEAGAPKEAYGSPDGWDDRRPPGDPWATETMKALNTLEFPAGEDQAAMVQFMLRVCKDGSIHPELVGDNAPTPLEEEALARLGSLKVPPPPPEIQAAMRSDCAKVKYLFEWTPRGVR